MTTLLAFVPALFVLVIGWRRGPEQAFLNAYLPALLLLPDYYYWPGSGKPSFVSAAAVAMAAVALARGGTRWRPSATDALVLALVLAGAASEWTNAGQKEGQNLFLDWVTALLLPYVIGKGLIEPAGLSGPTARRMAFLLFAVAVFSLYEFRFGLNPYRLALDRFFPGQGLGWIVSLRWGFGRTAGPFGHAILAGMVMVVGYRMARYADWRGLFPPMPRPLRFLRLRTGAVVALGLVGGALMTMARGPWLGGLLAGGLAALGRTRRKWFAFGTALALLVAIGIPAVAAFRAYVMVGRAGASSDTQETAAYRFELLQNYLGYVDERPLLGWGRNTWPKVPGQPSIDNYYLLLMLMHGYLALALLLAPLFWVGGRLFRRGMTEPFALPPGSSLAFTLLGAIASMYVSIATVFLGLSTRPLLFLLIGWAEGHLLRTAPAVEGAVVTPAPPPFRFARVLS